MGFAGFRPNNKYPLNQSTVQLYLPEQIGRYPDQRPSPTANGLSWKLKFLIFRVVMLSCVMFWTCGFAEGALGHSGAYWKETKY